VRIVQLSDLHLTAAVGGSTRGCDVWRILHRVLGTLPQFEPIDLLVLTGDLVCRRRRGEFARGAAA